MLNEKQRCYYSPVGVKRSTICFASLSMRDVGARALLKVVYLHDLPNGV